MTSERKLLEDYVASGTLMQVATISEMCDPSVCNVWYHAEFYPDRLYFLSPRDCEHSANIRANGRVAGSIVSIPLTGLGQKVRGVSFKGVAWELESGAQEEVRSFLSRWPRAQETISAEDLAYATAPSRLYEIIVREWVLFDEENYPQSPRRPILAAA
jgi:uncharacterized protein YhbP (UPF0306 family)